MPINTRDRKLLWARTGGTCALCKCHLTADAKGGDRDVVLGEEAHIVSEEANGPRFRPMPKIEVDSYANHSSTEEYHYRKSGYIFVQESSIMTICEWAGCADAATHAVDIFFPEGAHETWEVCREHDRQLKLQVVRSRPKALPRPETPMSIEVRCNACQQTLDESHSLPADERQPCPNCGSLERLHKITIVETLSVHESIRLRSKKPGKGGWMRDLRTGDDYSRYLEGWGERVLDVDRKQNIYREVIKLHDNTRLESRARLTDHHG